MIGPASDRPLNLPGDSEVFRQQILQRGVTVVGFGDVHEGLAPDLYHLPIALCLGVLNHALDADRPAYNHADGTGEAQLLEAQKWIVTVLRTAGYRYLALPPDSHRPDRRFIARLYPLFAHKTAATCAGLGWIGRNGLLIHARYGPRLIWATVLTNAPLTVGAPIRESTCGGCNRCVEACPAGAILGRTWRRDSVGEPLLDVNACAAQLESNRMQFGLAVCGRCVVACPFGTQLGGSGFRSTKNVEASKASPHLACSVVTP